MSSTGNQTTELLPCPFCGGEVIAIETHPGRGELYCDKCDLVMGGDNAKTPEELTQAWNTRAERTCHIVQASRKYVLSDGTELYEDGCSVCNGYLGDGDNYCPNCGRKVVQ